jgi:hypothetical protein
MATSTVETYEDGVLIHSEQVEIPDPDPAEAAAVTRWRGMGFTDEEIVAMYPHLSYAVEHTH